jgi:hypothetical protein
MGGFVISGNASLLYSIAVCHSHVIPFRYPLPICPDGHNARQAIL